MILASIVVLAVGAVLLALGLWVDEAALLVASGVVALAALAPVGVAAARPRSLPAVSPPSGEEPDGSEERPAP
jgi:hypothetical protein